MTAAAVGLEMAVEVHLCDLRFEARCPVQDCYLVPTGDRRQRSPEPSVDPPPLLPCDDAAETSLLVCGVTSPFLLQRHDPGCRASPSTSERYRYFSEAWQCPQCGGVSRRSEFDPTEDADARAKRRLFSRFTRSKHRHESCTAPPSLSTRTRHYSASAASHTTPFCGSCAVCPRCDSGGGLEIAWEPGAAGGAFVALCTYCQWRSDAKPDVATVSSALLAGVAATGAGRQTVMLSVGRDLERQRTGVSVSRLALEAYDAQRRVDHASGQQQWRTHADANAGASHTQGLGLSVEAYRRMKCITLDALREGIWKRLERGDSVVTAPPGPSSSASIAAQSTAAPVVARETQQVAAVRHLTMVEYVKDTPYVIPDTPKSHDAGHSLAVGEAHPLRFWTPLLQSGIHAGAQRRTVPYAMGKVPVVGLFAPQQLQEQMRLRKAARANAGAKEAAAAVHRSDLKPAYISGRAPRAQRGGECRIQVEEVPGQCGGLGAPYLVVPPPVPLPLGPLGQLMGAAGAPLQRTSLAAARYLPQMLCTAAVARVDGVPDVPTRRLHFILRPPLALFASGAARATQFSTVVRTWRLVRTVGVRHVVSSLQVGGPASAPGVLPHLHLQWDTTAATVEDVLHQLHHGTSAPGHSFTVDVQLHREALDVASASRDHSTVREHRAMLGFHVEIETVVPVEALLAAGAVSVVDLKGAEDVVAHNDAVAVRRVLVEYGTTVVF